MSVETTTTKIIYTGNGMTTEWPIPFQYNSTDDICLMLDDGTTQSDIPSNFKFSINESGDTSVIYPVSGVPVDSGKKLIIYRQTPRTQIVDLVYGGAFSPEVLEKDGFDRIVMMLQEIYEELSRAIKVAISSNADVPTVEELLAQIADLTAQAEAELAAAQAAIDSFNELQLSIPLPESGDEGKTLYVVDVDGTPKYVLVNTSGGTGSAGYVDYSIQARESSGRVEVNLAELQHPEMPGVFNPFVNIISRKNYNFVLESRSKDGFVIQLYKPNGSAGVDFAEYIEFGTFAFGEGHVFGEEGTGSDVEIVVSIPLPPIE